MKKILLTIAIAAFTTFSNAQHSTSSHQTMNKPASSVSAKMLTSPKYQQLHEGMRTLWNAHMYWTLITVDAFFNDPKGLDAKLKRLLQNQQDIGSAIKPYYGEDAGNQLAKLLTEHIQGAVPVLTAAKNNDQKSLDIAVKNWYANAKEIGDFLSSANPKNWSAKETEGALEMHITHTIAYSVNILKGEYTQSFGGFEEALHHMTALADILTDGIAKQFPEKF